MAIAGENGYPEPPARSECPYCGCWFYTDAEDIHDCYHDEDHWKEDRRGL